MTDKCQNLVLIQYNCCNSSKDVDYSGDVLLVNKLMLLTKIIRAFFFFFLLKLCLSFFLISNKFIDIKKGSTLVHRECTRGQTIKNKNYKNLGNQEKIKMIGSAMQLTNP